MIAMENHSTAKPRSLRRTLLLGLNVIVGIALAAIVLWTSLAPAGFASAVLGLPPFGEWPIEAKALTLLCGAAILGADLWTFVLKPRQAIERSEGQSSD
jgi:hypothetical protein